MEEFYFQWHLTHRCNLGCKHCYQASAGGPELDWTALRGVAARLVEALSQWQRRGHIALTGGEPLLRPELCDLVEHLASHAAVSTIDLLTNGTLLTPVTIDKLARIPKVRRVQVSLDGSQAQTHDAIRGSGAFKAALDGIRRLVSANVPTRVMFTLHRGNVDDLPELVDLALREGLEGLSVDRLVPVGRGARLSSLLLQPEELRRSYEYLYCRSEELASSGSALHIVKLRTLWALVAPEQMARQDTLHPHLHIGAMCSAGMEGLCILEDATALPCRRLPIPVGNLLRQSVFDIWYTSPVLWQLRDRRAIKGKCGSCEYASRCGGCRAMAYSTTGDFMEGDPQCWKD